VTYLAVLSTREHKNKPRTER